MKVIVPEDHGATDVLREEAECVVVRPHHFDGDTYVPLWYNFRALNDTGHDLPQAGIIIEGLAPGIYQPYWQHCVWSRDGNNWERIPESARQLGETSLTIETPLAVGEGCRVAVIWPLPYAWYESLCNEMATPSTANSGWSLERRQIGNSVEGRPLYAFHIGRGDSSARRHLLIVAGQHAVEQSGKMFAENVLRGYHSGEFRGTPMEDLLQTHNVTVVPLANPDGCYHGRMNSNVQGIVIDRQTDNSVEAQAVLSLIDEIQPHVLINCHGWGNEIGTLPYEDIYRFSDNDPLFLYLKAHVPGCSSSGLPHLFDDGVGRIEHHAHARYGTECTITEVNYHWHLPPDGGAPRQPTRPDINDRIRQYLTAMASFCKGSN
jgi:hypothetical protein